MLEKEGSRGLCRISIARCIHMCVFCRVVWIYILDINSRVIRMDIIIIVISIAGSYVWISYSDINSRVVCLYSHVCIHLPHRSG